MMMLLVVLNISMLPCIHAEPTGAQLLDACRSAIRDNFNGLEGSMCDWYVTPCDCTVAIDNNIPRVCLPPDISREALARTVVQGLESIPDLAGKDAARAAAIILSEIYPCEETDTSQWEKGADLFSEPEK